MTFAEKRSRLREIDAEIERLYSEQRVIALSITNQ